jgi:hypothetical protein
VTDARLMSDSDSDEAADFNGGVVVPLFCG